MILLLLSLGLAHAADPPCRPSLVSVLAHLEPPIQAEQIDATTYVLSLPESVLVYRVDGETLVIESARTEHGAQLQGLNSRLFREMLDRHPSANVIESTLMDTNLAIYREAERRNPGAPCATLVLSTPAARVRLRAGFRTVTECVATPLYILFRMAL